MNINVSIIDQRLSSVAAAIQKPAIEELGIIDAGRLKSLAFVYLCVKTMLNLDDGETFDCLTEGDGDFGVDAMLCTSQVMWEHVNHDRLVKILQASTQVKGTLQLCIA